MKICVQKNLRPERQGKRQKFGAHPVLAPPEIDPLATPLLQAEKLAQTILEVQKKMPQAIKLLDQMWNLYSGIYVPKKECFYPNLEVITEVSFDL